MDGQPRRRKVLLDRPASEDAFSGGGHKRTATSLAHTIQATRSIGLEGKWGSGKSTIVEIAAKLLEAASSHKHEYYVFTFDLWTNQNASFRRAFLESLLSWLEGVDDTRAAFVQRVRDRIRDRVIETKTLNTKVFSAFGLTVLVFMLALPWLYMWLSPFALRRGEVPAPTVAAAIIVGLMVIATIFNAVRIQRARSGNRFVDSLSSAISMFSTDAQTTHLQQNIRETDPTQTAFENTLKEILSEFQTTKRSIIIIFDNIDRLPPERIVEAWSDIRSVLSARRHDDSASEKLTVIVPYDRAHVLNAMARTSDAKDLHDDVFRKSFDAIFYVAPPVLSDAADYFYRKFEEAIGEHYRDDLAYRVFKIYQLTRADETATPRQIISFINSIASLWEQWGDVIELPTMAIFALKKDEIERKPSLLRDENAIDPRIRELAQDDNLPRNLAALWFNVAPVLAFQILLNNRIEQVFTSAEEQEALELSRSPGFDIAIPEVFNDSALSWAQSSVTQFKYAVHNLSILGIDRPSVLHCKARLLSAFEELEPVPPDQWEASLELLDMYSLCSQDEAEHLTASLGSWLSRSLPDEEDGRTFKHGQQWIAFVSKALEVATPVLGEKAAEQFGGLTFPAGGEFLVGAAYDAEDHGIAISTFKNAIGGASANDALNRRLTEDPGAFYHAWPELHHLIGGQAIPSYLERLAEQLTSKDESGDVRRLGYLIGSFNTLYEKSEKNELLVAARKQLVGDGALYFLYGEIAEMPDDDIDVVDSRTDILWTILSAIPTGSLPAVAHHAVFGDVAAARELVQDVVAGKRPVDPNTFDSLVERTIKFQRLSLWVRRASAAPEHHGLLRQTIKATIERGVADSALPLDVFASSYTFLQKLLGSEIEGLLVAVGLGIGEHEAAAVEIEDLPLALISDVATRREAGWVHLIRAVDAWLRAVDSDQWKKELASEESFALEVLRSRVDKSGVSLPAITLRNVVAEHVVEVFEGGVAASPGSRTIVAALPKNTREALPAEVFKRLSKALVPVQGFEAALSSFPDLLAKMPFDQDRDCAVRNIVMPAIQSTQEDGIGFLDEHRRVFRKVLGAVDQSLIGEVQDLIGADADDEGDDVRDRRRRMRDILKLPAIDPAANTEDKSTNDE